MFEFGGEENLLTRLCAVWNVRTYDEIGSSYFRDGNQWRGAVFMLEMYTNMSCIFIQTFSLYIHMYLQQ